MRRVSTRLRNAPGAQREEHRQHDGKFLRHHGDRERQARQGAIEPPVAGHAVHDADGHARTEANHGQSADDAIDFGLQHRPVVF
jgi:hypothetical protein